ncbi:MAG: dihydrolipoyl dehydrogenase [Syntrophaceae bacterium CG2_30_49_12]|nr:MAG: dihydrolipoyl dehydrogenase [Syntrophaceae bacterium CG2_30_49_12]
MSEKRNRIAIIGGGPGGYVAAICAAQLGGEVTLIEKDRLGGTCLNRGCIPTKSLLQSAGVLRQIERADTFGISIENLSFDYAKMRRRKEKVVQQLLKGIGFLMKKNNISVISGTGTIVKPGMVKVAGSEKMIEADKIIIATGSEPASIPIAGADRKGVISSDEAIDMEELPESMIIIGGGVIGVEFAQLFCRLKTRVAVIEMMPRLLPTEDAEIALILERKLTREGVAVYTDATVKEIGTNEKGEKVVTFSFKGEEKRLVAGKVLIAVGRRPCTENLGLEKLSLPLKKDRIVVNNRMETDIENIYAIGDVVGDVMLAHKSMAEGRCAAQNAMGIVSEMDYRAVPRCVYTSPEVAAVGLTEREAREKYGDIKIGKFPFRANGKALILDETDGMVKFIVEPRYGEVLGVGIIGPHATEMIGEAALGIKLEASFNDFASSIHAHPTLSEGLMEAALTVEGKSLHI